MNIDRLTDMVVSVNGTLQAKAKSAVNMALTVRNWLIGYYIVEFEQHGEDRARYGTELLKALAGNIARRKIEGFSVTNLRLFRQFYTYYPEVIHLFTSNTGNPIFLSAVEELQKSRIQIHQSATDESKNALIQIHQPPIDELQEDDNQLNNELFLKLTAEVLQSLSFTHISLLLTLNSKIKRNFYAIEAIKGVWSVRELKRQINSLYFERSGLSKNKLKLSQLIAQTTARNTDSETLRNPMVFEFLGLPLNETLHEAQLEKALMDNLQKFLLELGYGFCFEARQKRILIDDEYFFIDLVFYHRILKCHILIELKAEAFTHQNIGQLQAYLQYYKEKVALPTDNLPIGILLCTKAKAQMVRYATTNKDNLLVNEYRIQLPDESELQHFVEQQLKSL